MIFRQLFEPVSSTSTYLLACETTGQAMLIDPVVNAIDRDLQLLQSLRVTLTLTPETHIHADHITAALQLKQRVGSRIAAPAIDRPPCVDVGIEEGTPLHRRVSSIGQEKRRDPRLGHGRTLEEFKNIMSGLDLPYPKFIDYAVPGNRRCGVCPDDLPEQMRKYCERITQSQQG
jgi:glyoxylase-like metal-dependent hydrolase (beta-lactamase superfamily II)